MALAGAGRTRVVVVLCAVLLGSGCVSTGDGTATHAASRSGTTVTSLARIMPSDDEIRVAIGNDLQQNPPPRQGGIEVLPDGIRSNNDAAPIECIGAISSRMHSVYEKGPVRDAAVQDYWNYDLGVAASSATVAAVRFASAADAQRLFTSFVQQWQSCSGTTVTMFTWDSSKTLVYAKVADVQLNGSILAATITRWDNHETPPFPVERALGMESDVIADVEVALRPHVETGSRATDLVKVMLRKLSSTN